MKIRFLTALVLLGFSINPGELSATDDKHPVAPEWQLKDLNGHVVKLSDFKGKVILLDFWATWCPPCRQEIPIFVQLQKKYAAKGLSIVGISVDEGGAGTVTSFARSVGINYPVVVATEQVLFLYGGIQTIPTTFIIDRAGKVVAVHGGNTDLATFEREIKPLL